MKVNLERGPKGKKHAAYAIDWPGLERGGKTEDLAIETLDAYRTRYEPIAKIARMVTEFRAEPAIELVETYDGPGSTDFWGISFGNSPSELSEPYTEERVERDIRLLEACWQFFEDTLSRVSPELRKGPRGGGRDRDEIVRHVMFNEADWAKGVGLEVEHEPLLQLEARQEYRQQYTAALRQFQAEGKKAGKKSTLPFLIRHSAYHTLDHAWEMEDKDLSGEGD